jgi:phenylacetate-CoA ligase
MSMTGIPGPEISRQDTLRNLMALLEQTQWLSGEMLEARQWEPLNRLLAHHIQHTPFYRNLLGDFRPENISQRASFRQLPILKRATLQSAGEAFCAQSLPPLHAPAVLLQTSGSTGEPVKVYRTAVSALFWSAYTLRDHLWHRRDFSGRLSAIRANVPAYVELDNWGPPSAGLYHTGPAQGIPITFDIDHQLELLERFAPTVLIVYPGNLRAFLERWRKSGFRLHSLRHLKTIGETVAQDLREETHALTGLKIEDQYSSNELGVIAIQCPDGDHYHVMSDNLMVEVLDAQNQDCLPGQAGRLVITDLTNFASPLIRYEIGDWAEVSGPCSCGRGLPALRRILGRERNLVIKPDGTQHWPLLGFDRFREIAPVEQYQFVQHSRDEIEFRVFTRQALSVVQIAGLIEVARKNLGYPFSIRVVETRERLPAKPNGKFEEFICLCR